VSYEEFNYPLPHVSESPEVNFSNVSNVCITNSKGSKEVKNKNVKAKALLMWRNNI
jgi:hypothetical protein